MRRRWWAVGTVAVLGSVALLGAACGGGSAGVANAPEGVSGNSAPERGRLSTPGQVPQAGELSQSLPKLQARIIKTGTISLSLPKGSFNDRIQKASLVAAQFGGYVADTTTNDGKLPSGSLVIRVPAAQFEATMASLRSLGRVRGQRISGQDVTSQFVDLQARLRNWRAQESVLLRLMSQSTTIPDSLRVQNQLQSVQLQIEEITGQLRVLSDKSDLSTITLSMAEVAPLAVKPSKAKTNTFARAWTKGVRALGATGRTLSVALGFLLPFLLIAMALLLGWLGVRRLRPRVAPEA